MQKNKENSSFRDPSGYVYYDNNDVHRIITGQYIDVYEKNLASGFYKTLIEKNLLINFKESKKNKDRVDLIVEKVPFITYPYEWSFFHLKDAALLTLKIMKESLRYNVILKDASAYNIQFVDNSPIFIDIPSFINYEEGMPWGAYQQFCKHFFAPLLLMAYVDVNLNCLMKDYIDGIPLDMAASILKNRGGLSAIEHIKLHSKALKNTFYSEVKNSQNISKKSLINMIDMMSRQIESLNIKDKRTKWKNYYDNTNYSEESFKDKERIVDEFLKTIKNEKKELLIDFGANNGHFSRIAAKHNYLVISCDNDICSVNENYIYNIENNINNVLPLMLDLTNPSPAIGVNNIERKSFIQRGKSKVNVALAIIHHMCISNNIPFNYLADLFGQCGEYLIIEFVPKDDSKVQELLKGREDIYDNYTQENFEITFKQKYNILDSKKLMDSNRTIYLMENKNVKKN